MRRTWLTTMWLVAALLVSGLGCAAPQTAAPPAASPQPSGDLPAWQREWNQIVEAARNEGEVIVWTGQPGADARRFMEEEFEKAYPGIQVTLFQASSTSERDSRYLAEREAGVAQIDVLIGGSGSANVRLIPAGAVQELRPFLVLPEVTNPQNWLDNKLFWADPEEKYVFQPETSVALAAAVNKSVDLTEIQSWWDLLDPKWKGKIVMTDPRQSGAGFARGAFFYFTPELGPEFTRRYYSETGVAFSQDPRRNLEWVADGRMLINISPDPTELEEMLRLGIEVNVIRSLKTDGKVQNAYSGGSTAIFVPNIDLPHPNAAKVFINWYLSKAGQQAMVDVFRSPSRRVDVSNHGLPELILPEPGVTYMHLERYAPREMTEEMRADVNRWYAQ